MNMLVMFSFIFALGIVVDDAIVVIENTHRIHQKTRMDIAHSAKFAAGEVFMPILSGTLTTLAPFFPLAFWPGVVGNFMVFIPDNAYHYSICFINCCIYIQPGIRS